jgi:sec-independent protein translocase protein TatA
MRDWMIPALLLTILLLFGSRKLPDMARSLGQSMRILKSETRALGDVPADAGGKAAGAEPAGTAVAGPGQAGELPGRDGRVPAPPAAAQRADGRDLG